MALFTKRMAAPIAALAAALTLGVSVAPAGASNSTLLPKVDPTSYHATPIRIETIVPGIAADLAHPDSWSTMHYWFARNLKNSRWLKALGSPYEYGFSALVPPITNAIFDPSGPEYILWSPANFDVLTDYVYHVASAQHVARNPYVRTVWTMFTYCEPDVTFANEFPCGISFNQPVTADEVAQHPDLFHLGDAIAVITEPNDTKSPCILVSGCSDTDGLSHEIAEAITGWGIANGVVDKGWHLRADPESPWVDDGSGYGNNSPWIWNVNEGGGAQLADITGFDTLWKEVFDKPSDAYGHHLHYTFTYTRIPHRVPSQVGYDPFFPAQPGWYYSTSTTNGWYDARHASSGFISIDAKGVAGSAVAPWTVTAEDASWDGQGALTFNNNTGPCQVLIVAAHYSARGALMTRGQQFKALVFFDPSSASRWCVVRFKSHRYGDESPTAHEDTGDRFHDDLVGIILPAALNPVST